MKFSGKVSAAEILEQENSLKVKKFAVVDALELGQLAKDLATFRNLPIALEVRIEKWIIYHASLPGSTPENQAWLDRKARVVLLKHHSTLYEKASSEERKVDWYTENNLSEQLYAIHGGGIPIVSINDNFLGCLLISGMPQIDDHLFGVEVIAKFINKKAINYD